MRAGDISSLLFPPNVCFGSRFWRWLRVYAISPSPVWSSLYVRTLHLTCLVGGCHNPLRDGLGVAIARYTRD